MTTQRTTLENALFHADRCAKAAKKDNDAVLHATLVRHQAALHQLHTERLAAEHSK